MSAQGNALGIGNLLSPSPLIQGEPLRKTRITSWRWFGPEQANSLQTAASPQVRNTRLPQKCRLRRLSGI